MARGLYSAPYPGDTPYGAASSYQKCLLELTYWSVEGRRERNGEAVEVADVRSQSRRPVTGAVDLALRPNQRTPNA